MGTSNENLFNFKPSSPGPFFAFKKKNEEPKKDETLFALKSASNPEPEIQETPQIDLSKPTEMQETKPEEEKEGNVFTSVFEDDEKAENDGDLMDSIIKTEDSENEEKESLLGPLPKIDTSMFIDEEYHAKQKLSFSKGAFALSFIFGLCVWGYFHMQLSPTFDLLSESLGSNVEQTLHAKTDNLKNFQTQYNSKRYLIVKVNLDNFTYYADEFLKRYNESQNTINQGQKQELEEQLVGLRTKLQGDYEEIKAQLGNANYVKIYREEAVNDFEAEEEFNELLTGYFENEKDALRGKETSIAKAEINEINEVISLVGNRKFERIFTRHEFESLTNESIKDLINDINGVVKNELSILHTIMDKKINWAEVIFEIENVTRKVDKLYGSGYFEDLGGIVYTGYDFDASSNRVSITGQTKRDDATNFSLIANLIDELEKSGKFKDVNMRSFTKSGSFDDGYVATLKLDFFLQEEGEETEGDEKLDPLEIPEDLL